MSVYRIPGFVGTQSWEIPSSLGKHGKLAAKTIISACKKYSCPINNTRVFYSTEEWKLRGENYGQDAVLIVVHENMDPFWNNEHLYSELKKIDMHSEKCTSWYTAIYRSFDNVPE